MDLGSLVGSLFDGMSGGVFGALTGILGSGVTAFFKLKARRDDRAHEKEMREMDQADMKLESELYMARDKAAADAEIEVASIDAFKESQKGMLALAFDKSYMDKIHPWIAGPIAFLLAMVDIINKTVRPAITYYFLYQTHKILSKVMELNTFATKVTPDNVISVILYLTVTAATWWLGQRPMDKMMDKIIPA